MAETSVRGSSSQPSDSITFDVFCSIKVREDFRSCLISNSDAWLKMKQALSYASSSCRKTAQKSTRAVIWYRWAR